MLSSSFKLIILLSSAIAVSVLTGCGSSAPVPPPKPKPVPTWVNSVLPSDTNEKLYGMAIAKDRDSAIKAALADMIARLGTTIESSYKSNEKVYNNSYSSSDVEYDIKADIAKIKVNNYNVIKQHKLNYKEYAVMIETDKQKFIRGLEDELRLKEKDIQNRYEALRGKDTLTQYNLKKELAYEAKKLASAIMILSELSANFDAKAHNLFVEKQQKIFLDHASKLKFYVHGNRKSTPFVDKLKNHLATSGFNISNSPKNSVNIDLVTTDNLENSAIKIAIFTIKIAVYDKSTRIGGKSVIIKERYNNSAASVYKNASVHFEQDIKNQGINKLIGINLDI